MQDDDERRRYWSEPSPFRVTVESAQSKGARLFASAVKRNHAPIRAVLERCLPPAGRVLEIASGTGQHIVAFAAEFPALEWTPSDPDPEARASIEAHRVEAGLANLNAPLDLDMTAPGWFTAVDGRFDAIIAINLIHIAPWAACTGLLDGARVLLVPGGLVFLYGCWTRDGRHLSESNVDFDRSLRHRNPQWGVRDTRAVADAARARNLVLDRIDDMPANNLSLILRRVT